jgi:galactosamine-6-phosphate isomerase
MVNILKDEVELAEKAAQVLADQIILNPSLLLCAATGNTPTATYQKLAGKLDSQQTNQLRILKLDEWGGISMTHPESCEQYLQKHLIKPLQIPKEGYFGFNSNPKNPGREIERIQEIIRRENPIDICVLGLGANGHIAFNEPADHLIPHCHVATLSHESMQHSMALQMNEKPSYGLTIGMADILQSKTIVMLISGPHKKEVTKAFLSKKITTHLPASFLWLHRDVHCFVDEAAYDYVVPE